MTSTLSDYSSSSLGAPASTDATSLAALFPATGTASGTDAGPASDPTREFASLMGASPAPAVATLPSASGQVAGLVSCASTSTRLRAGAAVVDPATAASVATVGPVEMTSILVSLEEPVDPANPREVTRDMLEEAATFVNSLLQTLLPEVKLPEFSAVAYQRGLESGGQDKGLGASELARAPTAPASGLPTAEALVDATVPTGPRLFTLAADGAIELKLDLAQFHPDELPQELSRDAAVEISAEMHRLGEIAVRLEAAAGLSLADSRSMAQAASLGREIFAGKIAAAKITGESHAQPGERNFVFTGDKQVKSQSPIDGITVAKTETTMPVAPIEEPRFSRNPEPFSVLPQRVDFQPIMPTAERVTLSAAASTEQNFAERAVETVTNLVDTQFSASMQKSGSVHLNLRFGGEDLSVRVEIRDGAVHTDFRTDSAELRSALSREWQAVAAQSPEQMRRFLDPVFSPNAAPAPVSEETPSSFGRQQQPQQDLPSRQARESWNDSASPFSRRSQLSDSFIPEPAAARGPAFLPTSLRLSALA